MRSLAIPMVAALWCGTVVVWAEDPAAPPDAPTPEQVKAVVERYIEARSQAGGVFPLTDDRTGKKLELELKHVGLVSVEGLWRVHDPSRRARSDARGYFACVNFHPVGGPGEKRYDVDFHVEVRDGKLEVDDVVIHKEPRLVKGKWTWEARFTRQEMEAAR